MVRQMSDNVEQRTRPQFGDRVLEDDDDVFKYNAWDNVKWDAEQEDDAKRKVTENSSVIADESERKKYETDAAQYWDSFYNIHQNRFFKDRHWLFTEFPELVPETLNPKLPVSVHCTDSQLKSDTFGKEVKQKTEREETVLLSNNVEQLSIEEQSSKPWTILEIGCGVGNTVFPILQLNKDVNLFVYCCDLSSKAVQILKENPEYDTKRCHAFEYDITSRNEEPPFPPESLDVAVLIFILSAINPEKMQLVVDWIFQYLRPGGIVVFRDYGRYDMAQIRFKKGRCLSGNFYARGDGTQVYFFAQDDVKTLFKNAGFIEEQNVIDRRLQVNRGKQLKMYRVWIQAKYRKPH